LYIIGWEYFSATSMIGVIALAGIAVGNAIILLEYVVILLERGNTVKMALVHAWWVRLRPILITSLTAVLGATTILEDPVRSWVAWAIILWLTASALLTTIVLPIFMYESLDEMYADYDNIHGRISHQ
jgi:multidrug efflux pump subunit AcrB